MKWMWSYTVINQYTSKGDSIALGTRFKRILQSAGILSVTTFNLLSETLQMYKNVFDVMICLIVGLILFHDSV